MAATDYPNSPVAWRILRTLVFCEDALQLEVQLQLQLQLQRRY